MLAKTFINNILPRHFEEVKIIVQLPSWICGTDLFGETVTMAHSITDRTESD